MDEFIMLQQEQTDHFRHNNHFEYPLENDSKINDLNRQIILALKKCTGAAFIGNINHYSPDTATILKEYTGQFIYNFGCDFCIPSFDELLIGLIMEWNKTNKIKILNEVYARIEHLGGAVFIWA